MSEHRADEDLNLPSFLHEGPDGSPSDTTDPSAADTPTERPQRTGAQIIGACLAGAREERGLSVEAVYQATRIRPELVRQIEAGDLVKCGGEIYARGHIRVIAQVVGLNAEALLREYLAVPPVELPADKPMTVPVRGKTQVRIVRPASPAPRAARKAAAGAATAPPAASAPAKRSTSTPPRGVKKVPSGLGTQKGANWTAAMAAVLLGLVVVGGAQLLGGHDKAADVAAVKAPVPSTDARPAAPAPKPAPVVPPAAVEFKVAAVDAASWLAVYSSSGQKLYDALLEPGSVQTFSDAHQLAVTLGNASAAHIQLNGKDLGTAGGDGQVVHLTVNPAGVVTS